MALSPTDKATDPARYPGAGVVAVWLGIALGGVACWVWMAWWLSPELVAGLLWLWDLVAGTGDTPGQMGR